MKNNIMFLLCLVMLAIALSGCIAVHNSTRETGKDGTTKKTSATAFGWGDQRTTLSSVRNGIGTNFSGTSAAGLDASTSASNANAIVESVISGAIQGAVKAAAKP